MLAHFDDVLRLDHFNRQTGGPQPPEFGVNLSPGTHKHGPDPELAQRGHGTLHGGPRPVVPAHGVNGDGRRSAAGRQPYASFFLARLVSAGMTSRPA
jgi:hypothetical protein